MKKYFPGRRYKLMNPCGNTDTSLEYLTLSSGKLFDANIIVFEPSCRLSSGCRLCMDLCKIYGRKYIILPNNWKTSSDPLDIK